MPTLSNLSAPISTDLYAEVPSVTVSIHYSAPHQQQSMRRVAHQRARSDSSISNVRVVSTSLVVMDDDVFFITSCPYHLNEEFPKITVYSCSSFKFPVLSTDINAF